MNTNSLVIDIEIYKKKKNTKIDAKNLLWIKIFYIIAGKSNNNNSSYTP